MNKKELTKWFNSKEFEEKFHYNGELGALYTKKSTEFRLWAPTANGVKLAFYGTDSYDLDSAPKRVFDMIKGQRGIWTLAVKEDLNGEYFNYLVNVDGKENEVVDPYARAVGVNGNRTMVVDLASTNPEGFNNDIRPEFKDPTDAIIYEVHIRDFTIDESSGIEGELKGKYKGFVANGVPLKHIKELGFTHIHLLPAFDYGSVDETKLNQPQFNWGYDPKNYNVPEGSYSTNPYKGEVRIKEFKEMVRELHKNGMRVVMDVVYNHTHNLSSCLNLAVPMYYYRQDEEGNYSDGSACGNETASDRSMFRKYMVDSVVYWAKEYHIDGFRFDLMGLHDIETMKAIREELDKIDKSIIVYGEGWTGGPTPLKDKDSALKKNTLQFDKLQVAAFSDDCRDCVKGHVFYEDEAGFVNGGEKLEEAVKFAVVASTEHPQVNKNKAMYAREFWANEPYQTVTYSSAHDNLTLWDKLQTVTKDATEEELIRMNKLIAGIVLTSQGIAFIHAGEELARTKEDENGNLVENSYASSDYVNKIRWNRREDYKGLMEYYDGLIKLRKSYKLFRLNTNKDIKESIKFLDKGVHFKENNVVGFTLGNNEIVVIYNSNDNEIEVTLPANDWSIVVNEDKAGVDIITEIKGNKVQVARKAMKVLVRSSK